VEPIDRVRVRSRDGDTETEREDVLAVEEPLEIRVRAETRGAATSFVTTMRTPGADDELAAGLLFGEGGPEAREDRLARPPTRASNPIFGPTFDRALEVFDRATSSSAGPSWAPPAVSAADVDRERHTRG
jgi:hypothetical protein